VALIPAGAGATPPGAAAPGAPGPRRRRRLSGATRLGIALFSPALVYLVALVGLPLVLAFLYSVGDVRVGSIGYHFVGLDNFRSVLQSPTFRRAIADSFIFTIASQIIVIVCANALALALRDQFRGRGLVRFFLLLPWVAPISLGAIGWKWVLDSIYSVVNWVLSAAHLVNRFDPPMWLGQPGLAMASVILVHSWRMIPFSTVILLAGLTSIPKEIPEAAAVDGAGFWRTHFEITLPMMKPIINVAVLFGVVFTFTDMIVVYILTRGGPYDTTQVLPSLAFFTGVLGSDLSEGAAISVFLVPILVVVAALMLRVAHQAEVV
jgi:multiple sugar transport system permease protein